MRRRGRGRSRLSSWDERVIEFDRTLQELPPEEQEQVGNTIRTVLIMGRDLPEHVGKQLSGLVWDTVPRVGTGIFSAGGPEKKFEEMIERVAPHAPTLAKLIRGEE